MDDVVREDWEQRQRAAMIPWDHPVGGGRVRATGPRRIFRWLLLAVVIVVPLFVLKDLVS